MAHYALPPYSKLHDATPLFLSPVFSSSAKATNRRNPLVRMAGHVSTGGGGNVASFEEGHLERPRWTGETPLSRLVGALISIKPLYSFMKLGARRVLISTAEKTNIPWRDMTKEILESEVYKELECVENPAIVYPDYYLNPFHAYDEGNLSWLAAAEAEAATMSMVRRAIPDAPSLDEANKIVRGNWLQAIEQHHLQYSGSSTIRDILDVGCSVGVSTRFLADKFPSANVTLHECPARAIVGLLKEALRLLRPGGTIALTDNSPKSKILQELSPVLFTLMKSTEPFLDEYYMLDLEQAMREAGFVTVCTNLTDPRHRTVTGTVPLSP
ncbi:uncharacterized protein LOC131249130 isoform X2 [Magnolia sinica]|uniref:uncharacterized protein LOC131249130 isoform X2 n=1 Tax=Magnolia sinica TaxID=86752 RepID=UPI00265A6B79|nr:uncharacterized protein LOC131249130 isoform X2 [Magnolia sinica]